MSVLILGIISGHVSSAEEFNGFQFTQTIIRSSCRISLDNVIVPIASNGDLVIFINPPLLVIIPFT